MEYKRVKIKGYADYEIDNVGNVYSLKNNNRSNNKEIKLSNRLAGAGYHQVSLYDNPVKPKQLLVHRLVWETFNGPIPKGMEIDHIDHNKTNNALNNLQLMSKVDNIKKAWDRRGRSAIKPIIKDWLERGYSRKFIADNLGVSQPYISMVSNGKR